MNIDEKSLRPFFRVEQRSDGFAQGFVIARHHEHGNGFAIVFARPDDQVAQQTLQSRSRRTDPRAQQVITKCKSNPVSACAVYRTLFNRNDSLRLAFVMPHDQPAAARS